MPEQQPTLHILDGGFRPRPEQIEAYHKRHEEFMPLAMSQPGFCETYGGPISGSPWWFFTAKFDTLENMERWQLNRAHIDVQDQARNVWWTGYYLRKGRLLGLAESAEGRILCETFILRDSPLSTNEQHWADVTLPQVSEFPLVPYETVIGERIPTLYLFSGPVGIAPQYAPVQYVLLTYWRSTTNCSHWQESDNYRRISELGIVRSSRFVIIPERQSRMGLAPNRLQREWLLRE